MQRLLERWRDLGPRHRGFVVALVAAALVAAAIAFALRRDVRVPLFATPLRSEQVAEVAERLAQWNVAFIAGPDNVRVDARRRNELLLRLSLSGVPHPHRTTSSEALERASPLVPQSVLDAQAREGLAGDVAEALRGLDGIEDAQVLIAVSRPAAFSDETATPPSAGVRLTLRPGARLDRARIDGIRQFVAHTIPGLDVAHVAILDDRGVALGEVRGDDESADLQLSLQSALDEAFGPGASIVRVRVDRDARLREMHDVRREPLGGRAIAGGTSEELYSSDKKHYTRRSASEDRGSDLREERTEIPAGGVGRISAAVAVDAARSLDLEKIRALASAALGLVDGRDVLSVEAVAFARAPQTHVAPLWVVLGILATLLPAAVVVGGGVALVRFGSKPLERLIDALARRSVLANARGVRHFAPAHVRGALRDEPPHTAAAIISALPAATATAVLELYPPEERAAIVRRMQRTAAPVVPDYESVLRRA